MVVYKLSKQDCKLVYLREAVKKERKKSMELSIPVQTPASQAEVWKENKQINAVGLGAGRAGTGKS